MRTWSMYLFCRRLVLVVGCSIPLPVDASTASIVPFGVDAIGVLVRRRQPGVDTFLRLGHFDVNDALRI